MTTARSRADGWDKVTGAARYAADWPVSDLRYAVLVTSTIPRGRILRIDVAEAQAGVGVVKIITHDNAPRLTAAGGVYAQTVLPLQDAWIRYEGQPVAVVVADRLERAQEAAAQIRIEYEAQKAETDFDRAARDPQEPPPFFAPPTSSTGDVAAGLAEAHTVVEHDYSTSARHHTPIEPSATLAEWRDGTLLIHDATQSSFEVRDVVSIALGLETEQVRVVAQYTGGGFGCKGYVWPHQIIAPMTAREIGGAVKLVLTRAQTFSSHGYQPPTRQRVALGATADGELTAIRHTSTNASARYAGYLEMAASGTRSAYACPSIETDHRVARLDMILPTPMRAPHEGPGMFALESALDELACELNLDPLELRLRNHADQDPTTGLPFSSKELKACYTEGARRFGWHGRPKKPGSMREGNDEIGWGMAGALMGTFRFPAKARIRIDAAGNVIVEAGTQEIGTGTRTIMPQLAAEALGCSPDRVRMRLGDTLLPRTGMTAGSSTTASVGSAVHLAARALRAKLASMALAEGNAPAELVTVNGADLVIDGGPTVSLAELLRRGGLDEVTAEASWRATNGDELSLFTYGAVFAEVRVDAELRLPRVSRLVGVYSAGRIVNPLTAHSQMIGGMTWGIGQALLEQSVVDTDLGRFVSKNLAGYLVPVNADIPDLDASFVEEFDDAASPIGAKGIGELGAVGVSAAIANAVYHATGIRVRNLPITPEALRER
jgi:xanthine dehydrogenase YagR molybdenum-binding subunit